MKTFAELFRMNQVKLFNDTLKFQRTGIKSDYLIRLEKMVNKDV